MLPNLLCPLVVLRTLFASGQIESKFQLLVFPFQLYLLNLRLLIFFVLKKVYTKCVKIWKDIQEKVVLSGRVYIQKNLRNLYVMNT